MVKQQQQSPSSSKANESNPILEGIPELTLHTLVNELMVAEQQSVQQQFQQLQLAQPRSPPRHVSSENFPPSKEEISSSYTQLVNYHIFTNIDPPEVLAYYMDICQEDGVDPLVDPPNLPDNYLVVPLPTPSYQNPWFL